MSEQISLPPLPFAVFDEFGKGADDRVQDYARAAILADRAARAAAPVAGEVSDKPVEPDPALIYSMAMRYRHDFGLLDDRERDSICTTMRQLWEEVVGLGFYRAPVRSDAWVAEAMRRADEYAIASMPPTEGDINVAVRASNAARAALEAWLKNA
jgi:hypothetical protein